MPNLKPIIKLIAKAEKAGIPKAERNLIKRTDIDKINSYLVHRGVQPVENLSDDAVQGMNDIFYSMKHHQNLNYVKQSDGTYKWQQGGNYSSDPIYWNPSENFEVAGKRRNSITGPVGISNIRGQGDLVGRIEGIDIIPMEYTLRMTSPKAENIGSQLSFIPKPLVKEFSVSFNKMVRPGSYYSADNVGTPIGLQLKRNIEDANKMREILIKRRDIHKNVDGLSTDSYAWILSQGTRPGLELRYSDNPMYGFNSQSHYGKEYMDLLNQAQNSKESFGKRQEFLDKWNNFIKTKNPAARPAYIDSKGDVAIPHPFIYKTGIFKIGGRFN